MAPTVVHCACRLRLLRRCRNDGNGLLRSNQALLLSNAADFGSVRCADAFFCEAAAHVKPHMSVT
jgi:hypothetical protein